MNIDWKTYPPLPEPPALPEWRDTPEREAYFDELEKHLQFSKSGCVTILIAVISVGAGIPLLFFPSYSDIGNLLAAIGSLTLLLYLSFLLFRCLYFRIRLTVKYHIFPMNLNRPAIAGEVAAIMANRPAFNEAEFRKYWSAAELADMALEIRRWVRENWALPEKMLYPNDSLMLLYEYKLTGDDEDYEDNFADLIPLDVFLNYDNTFAELVETTFASRHEAPQGKAAKP